MAVMETRMQWQMSVFLIGLFTSINTVSSSGHGERQFHSEILWHPLMKQNMTAVANDTQNEPKHFDGDKTYFQVDYDNVGETIPDVARFTMDFTTPASSKSLEKMILPNMMTGTNTSKKSRIIFNAYTEQSIQRNSNVTYTKTTATDGHPVNGTSGIYTAKTSGFYGFIFHAITSDSKNVLPIAELRVNGVAVATAAAFNGGTYKTLTLIAGAQLKQDDCVSIFVLGGPLFENVNKHSQHRASFAGTLMI
ncbi:hypothetical protein GHT06_022848 [Daphnia sinensis]|uniref:C1q domain-containing protein n=1 Tax=Daphnia sinensis TaxID=1820382 RepID=A0AAD5PMU0_9CRUS|nr:hypothetical protein GHT06_022848 [Daphnia sinensis]